MQRKLFLLAYFFIAMAIGTVHCYSQQYPFVYYTPKDGLINSRVRSIKQDSKGRMLFITYGGLSIYDGTRFTNYNQQDGLANDLVNDIVEVGPDSFLVATNISKLNTLVHGKVGAYQTVDGFYPVINRLFKSKNGNLYALADEGLFVFRNRKIMRLPFDFNGKNLGSCLEKIVEWGNFFLIIPWSTGLEQKLILYNKTDQTIQAVWYHENVFNIAIDSVNNIWVSTPGGLKLLDTVHLKRRKIFLRSTPSLARLPKNGLLFDASGNAWFYGYNELQKISPQHQRQVFSAEQGLKVNSLTDLFEDREGIIWMATDGNGVIKLKTSNIQLLNTFIPGKPMFFSGICQQNDTTWLFNSTDYSIYRITGNETKKFALPFKTKWLNIYCDKEKLYLNYENKIFLVTNKNSGSAYRHARNILPGSSNSIGYGILDQYGAVIYLDQEDGDDYYLSVLKQNKIIMRYRIGYLADQMCFDRQGNLWVASRGNHIWAFRINPADPAHYLRLLHDFSKGPAEVGPRSIAIDKENTIWLGTRYNGLYHLKLNGQQLQLLGHYTTKNGLTDNFVFTITCDSNQAVWAGTQTGLDKIFYKNGNYIVANVSKNNNLFGIVIKTVTAPDGTVWSVNNDGSILKLSPDTIAIRHPIPPLLFTSIKVNNQSSDENVSGFSFRQNNFSFSVAAPSFVDEKSILYSYYLEGSENAIWSEPSNNPFFSFINLSPGRYKLHVRCDFPEATYPSREATYSFTIHKPWWQTCWFNTSISVLVLGVLLLFIRSYYHRKLERQKLILEKKQAVEKERTRIATDMHDDLGAGLSRIKFLSETIGIKKQQEEPIEEDVIKIREYSHQMIDRMGEIVWALNERNDSLNDLIAYTRAYAVEYLSQNGIDCMIELPQLPKNYFVSGEFRRNFFLSVKEILHNIVKHAQASHVLITVEIKKGLSITIKDDGKGFAKEGVRPFSNGLYNIEKRMKDLGGTSEIKSVNGTIVCLAAPFV